MSTPTEKPKKPKYMVIFRDYGAYFDKEVARPFRTFEGAVKCAITNGGTIYKVGKKCTYTICGGTE